jgi:hypothetical protein
MYQESELRPLGIVPCHELWVASGEAGAPQDRF